MNPNIENIWARDFFEENVSDVCWSGLETTSDLCLFLFLGIQVSNFIAEYGATKLGSIRTL